MSAAPAALAVAGLRAHARRLVATVVAVVIGVGFLATTLTALDAVSRGVSEAVAAGVRDRDLVLTSDETALTPGVVDALRDDDRIEVVDAGVMVAGERTGSGFTFASTAPRGSGVALLAGRLPTEGEDGVAVATTLAEAAGIGVGDTVTFTTYADESVTHELAVVGVVDPGYHPRLVATPVFFAAESLLRSWAQDLVFDDVLVDAAGGVSVDEARQAVAAAAPGLTVRSGAEEASLRVASMAGGRDILGMVASGFGAVALVTAAIVIANTFAIVLTQRTRELALLRCVGATRGQVRRSVLTEAVLLGVVASTLGLVAGVGLATLLARLAADADLPFPVATGGVPGWTVLLLPWLAGVVVTIAASWLPTLRATRVAPLQALRPTDVAPVRSRAGAWRLGLGAALALAGLAALAVAVVQRSVPLGILGGVVTFGAVLLLSVWLVPTATRALGVLARPAGVPGALAVDSAVRHPGRAAATSAALLVGVTLITMTSVGAATATRTAETEIAANNPIDVVLTTPTAPPEGDDVAGSVPALPDAVATGLPALDSVAAQSPLSGAVLELTATDGSWQTEEAVWGVDPTTAADVVRSADVIAPLAEGTIAGTADMLRAWGVDPGDTVTVSGPGGEATATVVTFGVGWSWIVHESVMAVVAPDAATAGSLLRLADDVPVGAGMADVRGILEGHDVMVGGSAADRDAMEQVLDVLVLVTTGLLGVAVLIALVGIGNTLSLSVVERRREHALLRALGLTRGQLRGTLATEGVLLATVSAVVGVLLGTGYAWAGVQALVPDGVSAELSVPWARVAAVLVVAVVAGLLASVLPARGASRITPAAGLAVP